MTETGEGKLRVADCDTPGCAERMFVTDDEELLRAVRHHVDVVHPTDEYTDEQLREWVASVAFNVS